MQTSNADDSQSNIAESGDDAQARLLERRGQASNVWGRTDELGLSPGAACQLYYSIYP
jgi:hypothetical protein